MIGARSGLLAEVAEKVRQGTGVPTCVADVERVIAAAACSAEIWAIVDLSKRPFNLVAETARQLEAAGLASLDEAGMHLTDAGRQLSRDRAISPIQQRRCPSCAGRGVNLAVFGEALSSFRELSQGRPAAVVDYDQAYVTPETTLARIAFMADHGDLADKDLLILGDDDLMGLAAALTGLPRRIVVLEIDDRLVRFIRDRATHAQSPLEVLAHDLREPLPDDLAGQFHTFFTDPPETLAGLQIFIERGLSSLNGPGAAGYFGIGLVEASLYKWRVLQKYLLERDELLAITDLIEDFNVYTRWDYLAETLPGDMAPLRMAPSYDRYRTALCRVERLAPYSDLERRMKGENPYLDRESLIWTKIGVKNAAGT